MKTTHTPGPWMFSRWDEHGYTRFYIAQQEGAPYTPDYSDVASMVSETVNGERIAVQEANAQLIAAAPELLECLQETFDAIGTTLLDDVFGHDWLDKAKAAIAKATGA